MEPGRLLPPAADEVHLWRAPLEAAPAPAAPLEASLAPEERARAAAFRHPEARRRFTVARGVLRALLGRYLGCAPAAVRLDYGPRGKPFLPADRSHSGLQFNLSHSGDRALFAFALRRAVGVDLERIVTDRPVPELAARYLSRNEQEDLAARPESERRERFYRYWTLKEAWLKAKGDGLASALSRFEVALGPHEEARLLRVEGDPQEAARWTLWVLEAGPEYAAALAAEGSGFRIVDRHWAPDPPDA